MKSDTNILERQVSQTIPDMLKYEHINMGNIWYTVALAGLGLASLLKINTEQWG